MNFSNLNRLDSDLLRTFLMVVDCESFTLAGSALGRTQSAISVQMKRLESMSGGLLFRRSSRRLVLTERGELLLPHARRIVALLNSTLELLHGQQLEGHVRISIPEEYGSTILLNALVDFATSQPKVNLSVKYAQSSVQRAALQAAELDLGVLFERGNQTAGQLLMNDPTVWAMSETHALHTIRPVPIAIYSGAAWSRDYALRSLDMRGIDYRVVYSSDTFGGLKIAAAGGLAIAPISRSSIPAGCRELTRQDGFDEIDMSRVVLHRNPHSDSDAVACMARSIISAFGRGSDHRPEKRATAIDQV